MEPPPRSLQELNDRELFAEIKRRRCARDDAYLAQCAAERAFEAAQREQERRDWECYEMIDGE